MTLKDFTKIVLILPVPWAMAIITRALWLGDTSGMFQALGAFGSSIYSPALVAFVTGTTLKRVQERKKETQ